MKERGKFIVIEGLDGSGSTTQVDMIVDYLRTRRIRAYKTKEPTDNVIGGLIRGALTGVYSLPSTTLQLLFSADRGHHIQRVIEPIIKNGGWVICDRYMWSTVAFGGIDLDKEWLLNLQKHFLVPDLTFLLKVKPEICLRRVKNDRHDFELYEELIKLKKVWRNYEWLKKKYPNKINIISGVGEKEEIFDRIMHLLKTKKIV